MELHFINATNPRSGDEVKANKTRVRTLAMRSFMENKTKERAKVRVKTAKPLRFYDSDISSGITDMSSDMAGRESTDDSAGYVPSVARHSSNMVIGTSTTKQRPSHGAYRSRNLNPRSQTKSRLDPFSSFDVEPLRDDLLLCDFYLRAFSQPDSIHYRMYSTSDVQRLLIPMALRCPPLYHAMVFSTMARYTSLKTINPISIRRLVHEQKATQSIRAAIEASNGALSDEIILATTMLGGGELTLNAAVGKIHMQGVGKMVEVKGGIDNISNIVARNVINWISSMSDVKGNAPNKKRSKPPFANLERGSVIENLGPPYDVVYLGLTTDPRLATLMEELKSLAQSNLRRTSPVMPEENASNESNMDLILRLQTIELALQSQVFDDSPFSHNIYWVEADRDIIFHSTTLILCRQILTEVTGVGNTNGHLAEGIRRKILDCNNRSMHASKMGILLWILYVGGSSASGMVRTWFIESAKMIGGLLNSSWENVKNVLQDCIWAERLEELYYRFWLDCNKDAV